jgi:hypothetical protein
MYMIMESNTCQIKQFYCFIQPSVDVLRCTKDAYLFKICYQSSLCVPVVSGASVNLTSKVRLSDMLILPIVAN